MVVCPREWQCVKLCQSFQPFWSLQLALSLDIFFLFYLSSILSVKIIQKLSNFYMPQESHQQKTPHSRAKENDIDFKYSFDLKVQLYLVAR